MHNSRSGVPLVAALLFCLQIGVVVGQLAEGLVTTTHSAARPNTTRPEADGDDGRALRLLLSSNDTQADVGLHHRTLASVNLTSGAPQGGDDDFSASPFDEPTIFTAMAAESPLVTGAPPHAMQTQGGGVQDDLDPFQTSAFPLVDESSSVRSVVASASEPSPDSSLVLVRNPDGSVSLEAHTTGPKIVETTTTRVPTTLPTLGVHTDPTIMPTVGIDTTNSSTTTRASDRPTTGSHVGLVHGDGAKDEATTKVSPIRLDSGSPHSLPPATLETNSTRRHTLPPAANTTTEAAQATSSPVGSSVHFAPAWVEDGHSHEHHSSEDDSIIAGLNGGNSSIFGEDTSSQSSFTASAIVFHAAGDGEHPGGNGTSSASAAPTSLTNPTPTSHPHVERIGEVHSTSHTATASTEEPSTRASLTTHESQSQSTTESAHLSHTTGLGMSSTTQPGDRHSSGLAETTTPDSHNVSDSTADTRIGPSPVAPSTTSTMHSESQESSTTPSDHNPPIVIIEQRESTPVRDASFATSPPVSTEMPPSTTFPNHASQPIGTESETSPLPSTTTASSEDGAEPHHHNGPTAGTETTTDHESSATTTSQIHDHELGVINVVTADTPPTTPAATEVTTPHDALTETTSEIPHSRWHSQLDEASPNAFKTSFSLRFPNIDFSPQFNDPESGMSRKLKEQISTELDDVLKKTIGEENYVGFHITSVRKGSLIVDGEILTKTELAADTSSIASRLEENIAAGGSRLGGNLVDVSSVKVNGVVSRGPADPSHHLSHATDSSTHTGYVVAGAVGIGILITIFAIFAVVVFGVNSRRAARRTLKVGEEIGMTERGQGVACTRLGDGEVNFVGHSASHSSGRNTKVGRGGGGESSSNGTQSPYISPMILNGSQFTPPSAYKK